MRSRRGFVSLRGALTLAAVLAVAYFALLPLTLVLRSALQGESPWSSFRAVLERPANHSALASTLWVSSGTALLAVLIGLPMGWLVAGTDLPGGRLFRSLLSLPYTVPPYIGALAWTYLASDRTGWINVAARSLGFQGPLVNVYSMSGIVLVQGVFFAPLVLMGVAEACARIDGALLEAARVSGASPARAVADVVWPLVRRAAVGGALLAFLASGASYGVPALLGPSARPPVTVLTTRIKAYIDMHTTRGFGQATALSAMLFCIALLFPLASAFADPSASSAATRPTSTAITRLGGLRWPAALLASGLFLVTVALPFGALVLSSLITEASHGLTASNLSLVHWKTVLGRGTVLAAIGHSLLLAAGAATVALVVGGLLAYHEVRSPSRWRWLPPLMAAIPYGTPGTVLAIGLILAFISDAWGLNLYGSLWLLLVAYTIKELALAYRLVREGLLSVHPSLEEAARISGAGWGRAVRDVLVPMMAGHLAAAWFLVFMPSIGELTMSVLLFGPDTETVGTVLFALTSYEDPAAASVLAVLVVTIVVALNLFVRKLSRGRYGI